MKLTTKVGQIFLTHHTDQNYTILYQEAFSKFSQSVELFAVIEIGGPINKLQKSEYQKLSQILVSSFKKSYIASPQINQDSFERAVNAINGVLSRLASHGKVSWYNKLQVALAALHNNILTVSVTGNAQVMLWRGREASSLSEDLAEENRRPVKIFSSYATGKLVAGDRIIISTNQLFNYLSLERIREFLEEETLEETCQEIIAALADIKDSGFATFIFELNRPGAQTLKPANIIAETAAEESRHYKSALRFIALLGTAAALIFKLLWNFLTGLIFLLTSFLRTRPLSKRSKKYIILAIGAILILLAANIVLGFTRKSLEQRRSQQKETLSSAEQKLDEAEAALIYSDEKKVLALVREVEKQISILSEKDPNYQELSNRLAELVKKISKEQAVAATLLAQFPNIPTDLYRSPQGIIGFNRNSGSMAFYDFVSGEVRSLLKNQNTASLLLLGSFLGGDHGYIFLKQDGDFQKLNLLSGDELLPYEASAEKPDLQGSKIESLAILGEGEGARIYLLDTGKNQILRFRVSASGIGRAESWLGSEESLFDALDFAIDGSIYLLFPEKVEKYFNGAKQSFELANLLLPLENATRIFTRPDYQFLYLLEPKNQRLLLFDKQGKFAKQLSAPGFREAADIYVDEKNRIIYVLSGSELLQMILP